MRKSSCILVGGAQIFLQNSDVYGLARAVDDFLIVCFSSYWR